MGQVEISVLIRMKGGPLSPGTTPVTLEETIHVDAKGFGELMDVLERFHKTAEAIRDEQAGLQRSAGTSERERG